MRERADIYQLQSTVAHEDNQAGTPERSLWCAVIIRFLNDIEDAKKMNQDLWPFFYEIDSGGMTTICANAGIKLSNLRKRTIELIRDGKALEQRRAG